MSLRKCQISSMKEPLLHGLGLRILNGNLGKLVSTWLDNFAVNYLMTISKIIN